MRNLKSKMIKLKLEFATGEECRNALVALLGGDLTAIQQKPEIRIGDEKIAGNFEAPKTETTAEEIPVKKRRTKAEIEAEKAPVTPEKDNAAQESLKEDIQDDGINPETAPKEETASAVTAKMLQDKAVSVIRLGKKEEVTKLLEKFGAKSISQADKSPLKVEDYAAVMDELNKL
jgi:hypothetical protein